MNDKTWKQFKDEVDAKLKELNLTEDVPVWYIDVAWPIADDFAVHCDQKMGLVIEN